MNIKAIVFLSVILFMATGCTPDYSPKPKAYPRVDYPQKKYAKYNPANCPYSFDIPVYAKAEKDTLYLGKTNVENCWVNILFPDFNGTINLTYKPINDKATLAKLLEDAHNLTYKHTKKANFIDEYVIKNNNGVEGMIYDVGGDAASNFQFYLTDNNKHFMRGALYFYNEPNVDSMRPIMQFVRKDLDNMIETFRWK